MKHQPISLPKLKHKDPFLSLPKHSSKNSRSAKSVRSFQEIKGFVTTVGPYISPDEQRRKDEIRSKEKWIQPRNFLSSVKIRPNFIPNYVQATPSQFPLLHSYREINRTRWLAGDFRPTRNLRFQV
jgi:hypothetical protein